MCTLFTLLDGTVQKRLAHQSREGETCDIGVKFAGLVKICVLSLYKYSECKPYSKQ